MAIIAPDTTGTNNTRFPSDLPEDYHISFQFYTYSRPDPFTNTVNLGDPATPFTIPGTSFSFGGAATSVNVPRGLRLPIPANIVNTQDLDWGVGSSMIGSALIEMKKDANLKGAGLFASRDVPAGLIGLGGSVIDAAGELAGLTALAAKNPMMKAGAALGAGVSSSAGDIAKTLLQQSGMALNPVLTQQFTSPLFREHEFSWKLSPDSIQESQNLKNIIDVLTFNSLPGTADGGLFFTYPSIAVIDIHTKDTTPYKLKPCVIKTVSVNYAAAGVPSWFAQSAAPAEVELRVHLLEIILNTRDNFKDAPLSTSNYSATGSLQNTSALTSAVSSVFGISI